MGKKKAENYLLQPKPQSKEPEPVQQLSVRAIHRTGTPGPLTELLWLRGHGTGQEGAGADPWVCVYVCVCACVLGLSRCEPSLGGPGWGLIFFG